MVVAAVLAMAMKPVKSVNAKQIKIVDLLPNQFGDWKKVETLSSAIVNPEVKSQLDEIYSETVSQVYQNARGDLIMVAIAYGDTQSRQMQVHRPEVCYAAQGFQIVEKEKQVIQTNIVELPVMHLVAKQGNRVEPITYWIRIGDKIVRGNVEQGLARLSYGLKGKIPDGLLFRVSTISNDTKSAFLLEEAFIIKLLPALKNNVSVIIGSNN